MWPLDLRTDSTRSSRRKRVGQGGVTHTRMAAVGEKLREGGSDSNGVDGNNCDAKDVPAREGTPRPPGVDVEVRLVRSAPATPITTRIWRNRYRRARSPLHVGSRDCIRQVGTVDPPSRRIPEPSGNSHSADRLRAPRCRAAHIARSTEFCSLSTSSLALRAIAGSCGLSKSEASKVQRVAVRWSTSGDSRA